MTTDTLLVAHTAYIHPSFARNRRSDFSFLRSRRSRCQALTPPAEVLGTVCSACGHTKFAPHCAHERRVGSSRGVGRRALSRLFHGEFRTELDLASPSSPLCASPHREICSSQASAGDIFTDSPHDAAS